MEFKCLETASKYELGAGGDKYENEISQEKRPKTMTGA